MSEDGVGSGCNISIYQFPEFFEVGVCQTNPIIGSIIGSHSPQPRFSPNSQIPEKHDNDQKAYRMNEEKYKLLRAQGTFVYKMFDPSEADKAKNKRCQAILFAYTSLEFG